MIDTSYVPILTKCAENVTVPTRLGKILAFEKTDINSLVEKIPVIKEAIKAHGVVVLKNVHLSESDQISFGAAFGGKDSDLIKLPKFLAFFN